MADNIVGGLFGVDPAQLQQQRMTQDLKEGFMLAQLSPMERATAGIYAGSKQLGRAGQSLLGMEDPQLQEAAMAKKLSENFDVNSVSGLRGLAAELQKAGSLRYSQLAAQQANQLEAVAGKATLTEAQTVKALREQRIPTSPLGKLQFERQELLDAGFSPNDPRVLAYDDAIKATGLTGKKAIAASAPGGGPDTSNKAFEAADPEALKDYRTQARAAAGQLTMITQARENLPTAVTGQGLPSLIRGLNAQLAPLGINTETVASTRNLEQALKSIIAQGIKQYGANPSTVDLQFAVQAAADIKDPLQAISATLNYLETRAKNSVDKADAAEQYLIEKKNLAGFEKQWTNRVAKPTAKGKSRTLPSGVVVIEED